MERVISTCFPLLRLRGINSLNKQNVLHRLNLIKCISTSKGALGAEFGLPKLSPQEVTNVIINNEESYDILEDSIKSFETNQLASNSPSEDRRANAKCAMTSGMFFGVFDGHGGNACAQAVSERLFNYLAVSMLPADLLSQYDFSVRRNQPLNVVDFFQHENDIRMKEMEKFYLKSLHQYVVETLSLIDSFSDDFSMQSALEDGCIRLDHDMSTEALPISAGTPLYNHSLSVAFSGCVSTVAHVDGPHLHIANVGDCRAVLGSHNEDTNEWSAKALTHDHNCDNLVEAKRLIESHPPNESHFIIKGNRLLGQLIPLRAFGDVRYKWKPQDLRRVAELISPNSTKNIIPPNYYSPPYLHAKPEITYHRLAPRDKFLVLASDGLWDMLSVDKVVKLVGEHMLGRQTLDTFFVPKDVKLKEVNEILKKRKHGLEKRPVDGNVATHLIRNALGGTYDGVDHGKLSAMLTFPSDLVRYYRDDITVTVVYFDSDYLRNCPA